ncbi:MAG: hypothetical protein KDJ19_11045 [Hyphomicrobiaceae bacterium]|nr:hypothetical protein [Hyphomicrobiaceae bacterium]MCC0024223.1 hypothetical protein [Hyphomicrobiaceae bacterium]
MSKSVKCVALVLGFAGWATSLSAQGLPVAELHCQTTYQGVPLEGDAIVDLFQYAGSTGVDWSTDRTQMQLLIKLGRAGEIPGTLHVLTNLFAPTGAMVTVDVFLTQGTWGTGKAWLNGEEYRGTITNLMLAPHGFDLHLETQEQVRVECVNAFLDSLLAAQPDLPAQLGLVQPLPAGSETPQGHTGLETNDASAQQNPPDGSIKNKKKQNNEPREG